jgi:hypothetical protein
VENPKSWNASRIDGVTLTLFVLRITAGLVDESDRSCASYATRFLTWFDLVEHEMMRMK